jgi:hypothetical protein
MCEPDQTSSASFESVCENDFKVFEEHIEESDKVCRCNKFGGVNMCDIHVEKESQTSCGDDVPLVKEKETEHSSPPSSSASETVQIIATPQILQLPSSQNPPPSQTFQNTQIPSTSRKIQVPSFQNQPTPSNPNYDVSQASFQQSPICCPNTSTFIPLRIATSTVLRFV